MNEHLLINETLLIFGLIAPKHDVSNFKFKTKIQIRSNTVKSEFKKCTVFSFCFPALKAMNFNMMI